ncbi:DedA family protein [Patescibacteria group bacterium]|nr:DedA family protein [Patescibacteria group bacterium]
MFEQLGNQLIELINQVGYSGLFIASFLENLIPPIPSEVIMPLGGYLASIGKLNILGVVMICAVGSTLGNLPYYFVGRYFSHKRLRKFVEKYGKYVRYKPEYLDDLFDVFRKNDKKIVFLGRFLPGAR